MKMFTIFSLIFVTILFSATAFAKVGEKACDSNGKNCVEETADGYFVMENPTAKQLTLLDKRVEVVEGQLKLPNTMFGVVSAGGGYTYYAGADKGLGFSNLTLSFRYLRPVGPDYQCQMVNGQCQVAEDTNPHRVGLEVGAGFGSADKFFQLSPTASFLWYPHKHFGVAVGYQYSRVFDVAGEMDSQAHFGRFAFRIPVVDFGRQGGGFEIEFFGLAGYGEYPKANITHHQDPVTGQEFTKRTYSTKTGLAYTAGGSLLFAF